jgi:undecaprenyl-diphosphatase
MGALARSLSNRLGDGAWVLHVAVLGIVGGIWVFLLLATMVVGGSTQAVDEKLLLWLRHSSNPADLAGPPWLEEVGRDLTALGGIAVLCIVTASVAGYLAICRQYRALGLLLVATLGGLAVSMLLKDAFDRPRPSVAPHASNVMTSSFPSGHSMLSAVVYLTLGSLLARIVSQRRLKIYFLAIAMLLTFLVGVSRVYMGVHYPTDVLAGWCAGLSWALLCGVVARWLQRRGMVEGTPD